MRTLGIRPDRPDIFDGPGEKIEEQLGDVLQEAFLGSDGIDRLKSLTARMDALGLTGAEKVGLVSRAMQEAGFFNAEGQLDERLTRLLLHLQRLIEELEEQSCPNS